MTKPIIVLSVISCCRLFAGDIATVSAWGSILSAQAVQEESCSHTVSRGSVDCNVQLHTVGDDGFWSGTGGAGSDATAEVGYVYASAGAGGFGAGGGGGIAKAFALDDNYFVIHGSGIVNVTAHYDIERSCGWPCPTLEVTQAGVSSGLEEGGPPWVTSTVHLGVPFELVLLTSAEAIECCGAVRGEIGSIRLLGFFDENEQPLPYSLVPEPSPLWPLSASLGAVLLASKRKKRLRRGTR